MGKNTWKRYLNDVKVIKSIEYIDERVCRVIFDDFTQLELDTVSVLARGLCEGDELNDSEFEELLHETECITAKKIALKLLNTRMRTRKQMEKLLQEKNISKEAIDEVINELVSYGYIDDIAYAKTYIEYRLANSKKSWRVIFFELAYDGVDKELLSQIKDEIKYDEFDRAKNVAETIFRGKIDEKLLKKACGVLQRNGFHWDEIKFALADAKKILDGDVWDD